MGFVKILKNKAYSKRYQTKFRRRRQGKTDYYARKRLVVNDKDKYDSKKYRLVVRFTNRRVICSVVYSTIKGDMTVAAADSSELKNFGLKCGFTNYASAYATGLLLARRLLKDKKIDSQFAGKATPDGKLYNIENDNTERRPFKAYLDVGLVRTTTGNRVFGAMKGACDGGLNIPHNEQRFPGFRWEKPEANVGKKRGGGAVEEKEKPKANFSAEEHLEHIMGVHVQEYYDLLKGEKPAAFKKQFS
jgi:large subunit ribosomal protein L5e